MSRIVKARVFGTITGVSKDGKIFIALSDEETVRVELPVAMAEEWRPNIGLNVHITLALEGVK